MSIVAFKKKSVVLFGANVSGKAPGGYWLPQGPFGGTGKLFALSNAPYGPKGFSINGGTRNVGYVGKTMHQAKQGTRFRGQFPYGSGGVGGTYPNPLPVFNVNEVYTLADQYKYIKPSVLSTKGMLERRFRWINNGQYPNNWVQPVYTGNLTDNKSQGVYLQSLSAANTCVSDINESAKFVGKIIKQGPTLCKTSTAKFKFNDMARNAPYVKYTNNPISSSTHTLQIQRKCANPTPEQMPWPPATNGNLCNAPLPTLLSPYGETPSGG